MALPPKNRALCVNGYDHIGRDDAESFPAAEVRSNFSHIVKRAQINGAVIGITHHGNEVASVVSQTDAVFIRWMIDKYGRDKLTQFEKWLARQDNPQNVEFYEIENFLKRTT